MPLERWNQALAMIEERLRDEGEIDVAALADVTHTSEYHFRRVFSVLAGMPLSDYIRRRRLTVAAAAIVAGEGTVLDVALRVGYGSADAFSRAFRAQHGVTPEQARLPGAVLHAQPRMAFHLTIEGSRTMHYRIVQQGALRLVGLRARVPLLYHGVNPHIAAFIAAIPPETHARLAARSAGELTGIIAAMDAFDESRAEGTELDYYHAVVATPDAPVPDDFVHLDVPASTWVVFAASGAYPESLQQLWSAAFAEWLPSNPYRLIGGPEIVRVALTDDGQAADSELWLRVALTA